MEVAFAKGTVRSLLDAGAPERPALAAPDRKAMPYARLRAQVDRAAQQLNALGIGRNDRVALVVRNGPESAAAFLCVAAAAAAAPLNPAYREDDFRFYLSDLAAKALIVEKGRASPALGVARSMGVPVLEASWSADDEAGSLRLEGERVGAPRSDGPAQPADVALVLHTSGTTARPKMVPLTQANLAASAGHIWESLRLAPDDRCLNVMPLFHIHGIVAGVLASLAAGGAVICAPGLDAQRFFRWLAELAPTWYTAVPTMHQAVLAEASRHVATLEHVGLRFIRSSSAPLPPAIMHRLEQVFKTPVIEAYGMTEAAHQMASNPLPPAVRKPGTVGVPAGPRIAILGAQGEHLQPGSVGEVAIRGANVMSGYERNDEANAQAFVGGWFRTGDQGFFDADGYLAITGRLKEIINRGGEKLSPREIDEALLEHPDVAAAAAFPLPHATLGEEVGMAVVPLPGRRLDEQSLAKFLAQRLAPFKVPRQFVIVPEIPKGPTGKIQRQQLAAALGLTQAKRDPVAPTRPLSALEARLQAAWQATLGLERVGIHDNFFLLGGDSLRGVQLIRAVEEAIGRSVPQSVLVESGTIAGMAARIESDVPADCIVPFRTSGSRPPFFCVHDVSGEVLNLRHLSRHLGDDQPFYGIQSAGVDGKRLPLSRIEDMASLYIQEIRGRQPRGPYYIGGFSLGGWIAFEMARQLRLAGEKVALLALIDAWFGHERRRATVAEWLRRRLSELAQLPAQEMGRFVLERLRNVPGMVAVSLRRRRSGGGHGAAGPGAPQTAACAANLDAWKAYVLRPLDCDAVLFRTRLAGWDDASVHEGWKTVIRGRLEVRTIPGQHAEVVNEPFVRTLALELAGTLATRQAQRPADRR